MVIRETSSGDYNLSSVGMSILHDWMSKSLPYCRSFVTTGLYVWVPVHGRLGASPSPYNWG